MTLLETASMECHVNVRASTGTNKEISNREAVFSFFMSIPTVPVLS